MNFGSSRYFSVKQGLTHESSCTDVSGSHQYKRGVKQPFLALVKGMLEEKAIDYHEVWR